LERLTPLDEHLVATKNCPVDHRRQDGGFAFLVGGLIRFLESPKKVDNGNPLFFVFGVDFSQFFDVGFDRPQVRVDNVLSLESSSFSG
jgi:hypothetical protein